MKIMIAYLFILPVIGIYGTTLWVLWCYTIQTFRTLTSFKCKPIERLSHIVWEWAESINEFI